MRNCAVLLDTFTFSMRLNNVYILYPLDISIDSWSGLLQFQTDLILVCKI